MENGSLETGCDFSAVCGNYGDIVDSNLSQSGSFFTPLYAVEETPSKLCTIIKEGPILTLASTSSPQTG